MLRSDYNFAVLEGGGSTLHVARNLQALGIYNLQKIQKKIKKNIKIITQIDCYTGKKHTYSLNNTCFLFDYRELKHYLLFFLNALMF